MITSKWFLTPQRILDPQLRVFCFPYAGGSASTYIPWAKKLPYNVELVAVQPPGRSSRILEEPYTDMNELITSLFPEFVNLTDKPYILFGHSLGSRVAFELAKKCLQEKVNLPLHFFASGSRAPFIPCREEPIYNLPDNEFVDRLRTLNGTPAEVLQNKELMELCIPLLRSDFKIADTYLANTETVIPLSASVLSGTNDIEITSEDLNAWKKVFSKIDELKYIEGDHFFIESNRDSVIDFVNSTINKTLTKSNVGQIFNKKAFA
ncbi:thioesterase II family protein [Aliikangiella sp. G2MR2-5]|uniref:thioesterase II family protein n=1 Tax=Aliikangiella sp. G2MR2-5 TaxID=2788943 RepID=UPI0018A93301|nr:thioesterase [Aliikangiella sp. G2MR2-5]